MAHSSPITLLAWDSRFFGRRIARVNHARLTSAQGKAVLAACARRRVEGLYWLASADDPTAAQRAQEFGFRLADIRVTLTRLVEREQPAGAVSLNNKDVRYRTARPRDIPALQRLVRRMFPASRFALDPGFPRDAHERLFAAWLAKSVRGDFDDWVGVAEFHGGIRGFISCRKVGRDRGRIGLLGVARRYRGRGIGQGLLRQGFAWLGAQRLRRVSVATQGRSLQAQKFYQDGGFRTRRMDLWYHKWF